MIPLPLAIAPAIGPASTPSPLRFAAHIHSHQLVHKSYPISHQSASVINHQSPVSISHQSSVINHQQSAVSSQQSAVSSQQSAVSSQQSAVSSQHQSSIIISHQSSVISHQSSIISSSTTVARSPRSRPARLPPSSCGRPHMAVLIWRADDTAHPHTSRPRMAGSSLPASLCGRILTYHILIWQDPPYRNLR
jgi:hypothetical protein